MPLLPQLSCRPGPSTSGRAAGVTAACGGGGWQGGATAVAGGGIASNDASLTPGLQVIKNNVKVDRRSAVEKYIVITQSLCMSSFTMDQTSKTVAALLFVCMIVLSKEKR